MKNKSFTPQAVRKHVVLVGNTNVGKSSLLNAICEQDLALVSEIAGTTTDPVRRSYELLPYGPVVWIDTPGLSDDSLLGAERMSRSIKEIEKADFVVYILEANITKTIESEEILNIKAPLLQVFTKTDLLPPAELTSLVEQFPKAEFVSVKDANSIQRLRERIATELLALESVDPLILCDKLAPGAHILLVVPLDSEAPKGRMINPQNALLQEALKNGIVSSICTPKELHILTKSSIQWDWIITDSQAFKEVNQILTDSYINRKRPRLTSFSILMSRQKGNLQHLVEGAKQIENLAENDWVLIAEACSHSHSHEDIARIKIPFLLKEKCQKNLQFDYVNGKDFPEQMDKYALVIHCGGCMITRTTMQNRSAKVGHTPITNFGVVLAYLAGILPLAIQNLD